MLTMLINCATLMGPIIRLSVLKPSIKYLMKEYSIIYNRKISPETSFLFFYTILKRKKISISPMDSYKKKWGCTRTPSIKIPPG